MHAGEYIAVERLENVYKSSPCVEQIFIYGNSYESCLVAVVVPKVSQLTSLSAASNDQYRLSDLEYAELWT